MHEEIRKFSLEGIVGEKGLVQNRERLIETVESMMRDYGYVPSLDNPPQFTPGFNGEHYTFALTVYGVKVGKDKSWAISAVAGGNEIPKSTPKNKSKPSLQNAVSK